jgi:hypothetical protein
MQDSQAKPSSNDGEMRRLSLNSAEYEKEQQLMQNTHLLLTNLAEREKATVRAILDGLYEVGSIHLINDKVSIKALRGPLKGIASFSKPVFKLFAWRWFKRNCPELITNWLYRQVRFDEKALLIEAANNELEAIEVESLRELSPQVVESLAESQQSLSPIIEKQAAEILALRSRITLLSLAVVVLGVVFCWNMLA